MNLNNRKRKHRSYKHRDFQHVYSPGSSPEQLTFLGHHDAYLNTHNSDRETYRGEAGPSSEPERDSLPSQALYIQAYEADLIRGPDAVLAAQSLEVVEYNIEVSDDGKERAVAAIPKIGSALIQWGGDSITRTSSGEASFKFTVVDKDEDADSGISQAMTNTPALLSDKPSIWVDRYDARLLLDNLSALSSLGSSRDESQGPDSPSGWSDVPSDAEDMFFFTPDEAEDYHREKRRRLLDQAREERLKARMEEDGLNISQEEEDIWGGSDEEPDDTQKELMKRTATHLFSSPNPAQLEMRILANYGGDKRFAFLRGRWSHAWILAKNNAKLEKDNDTGEKEKAEEQKSARGLGVLAGYGSDSDSEKNESEETKENESLALKNHPNPSDVDKQGGSDEALKEARRNRLKEWKEKRKTERELGELQ